MSQFSMNPLTERLGKPEWENHISSWEKSGLSKAKYCKKKHISYHAFNYWKKRLREPQKKEPLIVVQIGENMDFSQFTSSPGKRHKSMMRLCIGEYKIEVDCHFCAEALSRLIYTIKTL